MAGKRQPRSHRPSGAAPARIVPGEPCPVALDAQELTGLTHETVSAMRRLRRDLSACLDCPLDETCQIRSYFNSVLQTALTEVMAEWSLERDREAAGAAQGPD